MKKAEAGATQFRQKIDKEMSAANKSLMAAGPTIKGAIMGALGALSVTKLVSMTRESLKFTDALDDNAKWLGVSAERLQEWQYAARLAGVDQERLSAALDKMKGKIAEAAADPKSEGASILRQIGLSPRDLLDLDTGLLKLADKIKGLGTGDQLVVGKALFGDKMDQFVQMLAKGPEYLQKTGQEARKLGQVLSNEVVARGANLNEEFETATHSINTKLREALVNLGPVLNFLLRAANAFMAALDSERVEGNWKKLRQAMLGDNAIGKTIPIPPPPLPNSGFVDPALLPNTIPNRIVKGGAAAAGASQLESFRKLMEDLRAETAKFDAKAALDPYAAAIADDRVVVLKSA